MQTGSQDSHIRGLQDIIKGLESQKRRKAQWTSLSGAKGAVDSAYELWRVGAWSEHLEGRGKQKGKGHIACLMSTKRHWFDCWDDWCSFFVYDLHRWNPLCLDPLSKMSPSETVQIPTQFRIHTWWYGQLGSAMATALLNLPKRLYLRNLCFWKLAVHPL